MPASDHFRYLSFRPDLGLRARSAEWDELLSERHWKRDLGNGLLLTATTLPLSILLASLAGAPAASGLLSAAIGSFVCVFFGGTRISLSGPSITSAIVSSTIIARHGLDGLGVVLALVGILQIFTGAIGLGRFARLAPLSLLRATVFGMGIVILLRELPYTFGGSVSAELDGGLSVDGLTSALAHFDPVVLALALGSGLLGALSLIHPKIPGAFLALLLASVSSTLFQLDVPLVPGTEALPVPHIPLARLSALPALLGSVFEMWAVLTLATAIDTAALERLRADIGSRERSDPDQELIGTGFATFLLSFIHSLPAMQLVARSAIGVRLHIGSRRPALIQAILLLILVSAAFPLLRFIPLAALTGVAVAVAVPLLDLRPLRALGQVSPVELGVSIAVIVIMVLAGIVAGLLVGLAAAFALVALRMTRTRALVHPSNHPDNPHQVMLSGPLTFLAGLEKERLRVKLNRLEPSYGLVLDLRSVVTLDGSGALSLLSIADAWRGRGGSIALLGPTAPVQAMLQRADETERYLPAGVERGQLLRCMAPNDRALDAILGKPSLRLVRPQLLAGLTRFREETRDHYNSLFAQLADGQHPHTMFITCADSRINPSLLMGSHPGDLFIVRSIGALVPSAEMGAMPQEGAAVEYAVGVLGVRTIVVCGHSKCGAISALKGGKLPPELKTLHTWSQHAQHIAGELQEFSTVDEATRAVTRRQIENLMSYPLVREKCNQGELHIHAWFYDLGEVELFEWDPHKQEFEILSEEAQGSFHPEAG